MKPGWLLITVLLVFLTATTIGTVASTQWVQESHRHLKEAESRLYHLLEQEQALKVEWVARTDLNTVEQRARTELGMVAPRSEQWQVVAP